MSDYVLLFKDIVYSDEISIFDEFFDLFWLPDLVFVIFDLDLLYGGILC